MMTATRARLACSALLMAAAVSAAPRQLVAQRPLSSVDIDDIARLLMLEDRRQFDDTALARILRSSHPEVRRRAVTSIGRIADPRGRSLVAGMRRDQDTAVIAAVMLATGQLAACRGV